MRWLTALCFVAAAPVQAACGMPGSSLTDMFFGKKTFQFISGHMNPTFKVDDCLTITIDPNAVRRRGDVIAFRHPVFGANHISRILGLPGDEIQIKEGQVILNGTPIARERQKDYEQVMKPEGREQNWPRCPVHTEVGLTCLIERYTELWPDGLRFDVLDLGPNQQGDNAGPFLVPEGAVFIMGDHRDNSFDSRFSQVTGGPGFIRLINIIGSEWKNPSP